MTSNEVHNLKPVPVIVCLILLTNLTQEHVLKHVMESRWLAFMPVGRAKIIEIADEEGEEETVCLNH